MNVSTALAIGAAGATLLAGAMTGRAQELFLSPRLAVDVGYNGNRFGTEDGSGSAFSRVAPAVDMSYFPSRKSEVTLSATYVRQDFLETGFKSATELTGDLGVWRTTRGWEYGINTEAGQYEDEAIPDDDMSWLSIAPSLSLVTAQGASYSLRGMARVADFESQSLDDGTQRGDNLFEIRPGVRYPLSRKLSLRGELYAEEQSSTVEEEEYVGYGVLLGLNAYPNKRLSTGLWVQGGLRDYSAAYDDSPDTEETVLRSRAWALYRFSPEWEFALEGTWNSFASDGARADCDLWSVRGGLRFVYDIVLVEPR